MSKCRTNKCGASCCYNIVFDKGEHKLFKDRIVTPIIGVMPLGGGLVMITDNDPMKNKCPFLREDCKCNIYENRPEVCRLFGMIDRLPCKFLKK